MPARAPTRRHALATALGAGLVPLSWSLGGCGSGGAASASGAARLRVLNLTSDLASIDVLTDDTVRASALGAGTPSDYATLDAATTTLKVRRAGETTLLLSTSYAVARDMTYTAVVWGRESSLRLTMLTEDATNTDITSGSTRLRVFNATIDAGAVDVFLTAAAADIGEAAATQSALAGGGLGGYKDLTQGSYRLRVTGAGDPTDIRLDVASVTLPNQLHHTLILTAGGSSVLLNGVLLPLQQTTRVMSNTQARVRVVAAVDGAGNVGVTAGSRTLAGGYRSPTVGPYTQIDAGTVATVVRVDGAVVTSAAFALVAGNDYTLLVHGSAGAAHTQLLGDDNRVPTTSSRSRLRLVNGTASADPLTLSVDYLALASDVAAGSASAPSTVSSSSAARIDVTAASAVAAVFSSDSVNLVAGGVYTVFVLSGNSTATGVIRRER